MSVEKPRATLLIDNDRVRVTEYRFAPGTSTGHHRHECDYVVVPMVDGKLLVKDSKGERDHELKSGVPYFRNAGVEHEVINATNDEVTFIEIEAK